MKICMFTNTYLPHVGGVARSVNFFTEDLRKLGHRVLVVAPSFPDDDDVPGEGEDVLRVPAIQNFNGSDFSVRIPLPFIIDEKIDAFKPDVIHSHHPFLLGDAAVRVAHSRDLPLVFTHHTLYEKYTHYVSSESKVMKRLAIHLSTEYANLCSRVVAPSESIADLIAERGVKTPIEVIPTGVDVDFFRSGKGAEFRRRHDIPLDAPVIGHLGRLAPEKNLSYLCKAVVEAMKKIPGEAYFLVVGSGPDEERIQARFEEQGLEDRLVMPGKLSGPDLADAYNAMDLFVFSSKSETQGMVLAEAMAAGIPVIALDASGAREVVEDKQNGRLLPGDASEGAFAESIIEYFQKEGESDSWPEAAGRSAEEFSRKTSADKLSRLYRSLRDETIEHGPLDPMDELLRSLKAEWEILSEKATAIMASFEDKESKK